MGKVTGHMQTQRILQIVEQVGVLRPRDLNAYGIPREYLRRLHARGRHAFSPMANHTSKGAWVVSS